MSDLDQKLRDIAIKQPPCTHCGAIDFTRLPQSAISQIKQVFKEHGWSEEAGLDEPTPELETQ